MPFPCGEEWYAYTHDWHWEPDLQCDWVRADDRPSEGADVVSSARGRVVQAEIMPEGTPYAGVSRLEIDHGRGWSSMYYHMPLESMPPVGRRVRTGQRIGTVGGVGLTPDDPTGPHLHYEQRHRGEMAELRLMGEVFVPPRKPEQALIESDNCPCR